MATFTGKVRGGSLNMRQSCSTSATRLASIPDGTTLSVQTVSGQNDWFQTSYSGKTGYVVAQYIAVTSGVSTCTVTTQSDPLNIRKTPTTSATAIYTAAKGSTLCLLDSASVSGWYRVSSASGTGWASSAYLTIGSTGGSTGGGTDDSYPIAATVETAKHGTGGTLNLRQSASSGAQLVTTIPNGATIYVKSLSGEWLAAKYNAYTGYVMAKFIKGTDAYGGTTGGGTSGGDATYTFNPDRAVRYALNHSENSSGVCSKRNTKFTGIDGSNDCADFVHQCLCAGGVPMFDGWFFHLDGIPSTWKNSKWNVTYSGCQKLLNKGWIQSVAYNSIQPGDIIYSYNANATPTPYTHVTIAVSENVYDGSKYGCRVCGYTTNQQNAFKELTSSNCRCYRVNTQLNGDGSEKLVYLPETGSGASVES